MINNNGSLLNEATTLLLMHVACGRYPLIHCRIRPNTGRRTQKTKGVRARCLA